MKRKLEIVLLVMFFLAPYQADAQTKKGFRPCWVFTGGGFGSLDKWRSDGATSGQRRAILDGDMAIVISGTQGGLYSYNISSTDAHNPPDTIMPVDAPASGRWKLVELLSLSMNFSGRSLTLPSEIIGTATTNPFYHLISSGGLDWYIHAKDDDDTLEINNAIGGQTRMKLLGAEKLTTNEATAMYLVTRDASGNMAIQHVTLGTTDSGGTGYRCLRVPNTN